MHPPIASIILGRFGQHRPRGHTRRAAANWFCAVATAGVLTVCAGGPLHAQNLLQNGGLEGALFTTTAAQANGFGYLSAVPADTPRGDEQATLPAWTFVPNAASAGASLAGAYAATGWYARDHLAPHGGSGAVASGVHSSHGGGSLTQTFPARAGAGYAASLWMARIGGWDPIAAAVEIHLPGNGGLVHRHLINLATFSPYQWRAVSFSFTAPAGLAAGSLEFRLVDLTPDYAAAGTDFVFDDVSVEEVVAPPVVSLLQNGGFENVVLTTPAAQANGFGYLAPMPPGTPHGDEQATLTGWTFTPNAASAGASFAGASVAGGWYSRDHLAPRTGTVAVAFGVHSPHGGGMLSQSFAARGGAQYRGTLALARIAGWDPIAAAVEIHRPGGGGLIHRQVIDFSSFAPYQWRQVEFGFTAPASVGNEALEFRFIDLTPDFSAWGTDFIVDDIVLWEAAPPPIVVVANAGPDQSVQCPRDTVTVTLDGRASSATGGAALSYRWERLGASGTAPTLVGTDAVVTGNVAPGSATFQLIVTTATGEQAADTVTVMVIGVPTIDRITPDRAAHESGPTTITVTGWNFRTGAMATWDGAPRVSTLGPALVGTTRRSLTFTAEDQDIRLRYIGDGKGDVVLEDMRLALVSVRNPVAVGQPAAAAPVVFTVHRAAISGSTIDSGVALPNSTAAVSTTTTTGQAVTASATNPSGIPLAVSVAAYTTPVVGGLGVVGSNPQVFDIRASGADRTDSLRVDFYYPKSVTGVRESTVRVAFVAAVSTTIDKSGARQQVITWDYVTSHTMIRNPQDDIDGQVCGGKVTVVFDDTTYPRLRELTGTPFTVGHSIPTLALEAAPLVGPVTAAREVTLHYNAVGLPADHQLALNWGDGTAVTLASNIQQTVTASHTYVAPGIYTVTGTITDSTGAVGTGTLRHLVAYDADGGFLTGGGWFNSAASALAAQPGASGKAEFELTAKYHKGATVPTGAVKFTFGAGSLKFAATAQEWLVVKDGKAALKARGTVNGAGDYDCLVVIEDGDFAAGRTADRIRVRITERGAEGRTIYDNRADAPQDLSSATQPADGGSIVVHKAK